MASQDKPNWAYAPRNATHWAPDNGDYLSAWYVPIPPSDNDSEPRAYCHADRGEDLSDLAIPTNKEQFESNRPHEQLIQRPGLDEGNDVDNW